MTDKDGFSEKMFFSKEPMFLYDYYTFDIIDVNQSATDVYGFSKDYFLNKKITDLGVRISESDIQIKGESKFKPSEIWQHIKKSGERFHIQYTMHSFRYNDQLVKLAIAHQIENIEKKSIDPVALPKTDEMRAYLPMGTIEWDKNYCVRDWSERAVEIFGWKAEEVMGKNIFELEIFPENLIDEIRKNLKNFREKGKTYFSIDSKQITKNGSNIYCRWFNAVSYNSSGEVLNVNSMVDDITGRKLAAKKLKESETRFRILSEASFVGMYMIQDQKFRYVNPRLCAMSGYTEKELVNKMSPADLLHPEEHSKFKRLQEMWLESKINSFEIELKIKTKQNDTIQVKTFGSTIQMNNKPAVIGVSIDQTSQLEAADEVKRSLESYQTLFDSISDAIYIQNKEGTIMEVNKGALDMYGFTKDEIIGKDPSFLAAPGKVDMDKTMKHVDLALNGKPQTFEWWGKRKNGDIFPKEINLTKGHYFGEDVIIAVARDVTDKYEREVELKQNEQLFRQLFQNSPLAIAMLDPHGDIKMLNNGFEEIFGYTEDELKGISLDSVVVPEDDLEVARKLSASNKPFQTTSKRKRKDGSAIHVLIYGVPVKVNNEVIAIYGIYADITDRINAEKQLKLSLQEKEVLLSEIHHRVKNNLAVITGLLELQSHKLENEEAVNALKDSQMRINSMALIHEKLYQNKNLSQIEFDKYTHELITVIKSSHLTADQPVNINLDCENVELPITTAIPCGLLINEIVTNSIKHAFNGVKGAEVNLSLKKLNDDVELKISDNGKGLPVKFEDLETKSLGIILIRTLTRQLGADLIVNGTDGTAYDIKFPINIAD